jgi:hypothetical protein
MVSSKPWISCGLEVVWWQGEIKFIYAYVRRLAILPFVIDLYFKKKSILEENVH